MSHSERNPVRLFLKCFKRWCDFFQWVDEPPKNLSLLRTGKKSLAGNSPLTRCSQNRHMKGFAEGVGPFERNWHPEGFTPQKNCTWNEGDWLHRHNDVVSIHWFTRFIRKTHLKKMSHFKHRGVTGWSLFHFGLRFSLSTRPFTHKNWVITPGMKHTDVMLSSSPYLTRLWITKRGEPWISLRTRFTDSLTNPPKPNIFKTPLC